MGQVAIGAIRHLPQTCNTRWNLASQLAHPGGKEVQMIPRERSRTHEAHRAGHDIPELRQLVETPTAEERAEAGDDARVGFELHPLSPLAPRRAALTKMLLELLLGV